MSMVAISHHLKPELPPFGLLGRKSAFLGSGRPKARALWADIMGQPFDILANFEKPYLGAPFDIYTTDLNYPIHTATFP